MEGIMRVENKDILETKIKISKKGKVHSESNIYETEATMANSKINEQFYHNKSRSIGISPALLVNNAPLVDTDDQYLEEK
jgi:hypothetical protein